MTTVLTYNCGCRYYSDKKSIQCIHLCDEHRVQAYNDALRDIMGEEQSLK